MDQKNFEISDLLVRIANQDRVAFNNLFRATSRALYDRLTDMLSSKQEAEDALQEVYVRVWLRATQFDPARGDGKHWLMAVARNYAIDILRRPIRSDVAIDLIEDLIDGRIGTEQRLIAQSDAQQIYACFQLLNPTHAAALQRAYLFGESYADLSLRYNVPLNTMRSWMRRSLQKLRLCREHENGMSTASIGSPKTVKRRHAEDIKEVEKLLQCVDQAYDCDVKHIRPKSLFHDPPKPRTANRVAK